MFFFTNKRVYRIWKSNTNTGVSLKSCKELKHRIIHLIENMFLFLKNARLLFDLKKENFAINHCKIYYQLFRISISSNSTKF